MVSLTFLALVPFPLEVFIILEHNVWYIAYILCATALSGPGPPHSRGF